MTQLHVHNWSILIPTDRSRLCKSMLSFLVEAAARDKVLGDREEWTTWTCHGSQNHRIS